MARNEHIIHTYSLNFNHSSTTVWCSYSRSPMPLHDGYAHHQPTALFSYVYNFCYEVITISDDFSCLLIVVFILIGIGSRSPPVGQVTSSSSFRIQWREQLLSHESIFWALKWPSRRLPVLSQSISFLYRIQLLLYNCDYYLDPSGPHLSTAGLQGYWTGGLIPKSKRCVPAQSRAFRTCDAQGNILSATCPIRP